MTDESTTGDDRLNGRTFLQRGVSASAAGFGLPVVGQPNGGPIPRVRVVVPRIDILANKFIHRLLVFAEEIDESGPGNLAEACFREDGSSSLAGHQAIVADWEGISRLTADTI